MTPNATDNPPLGWPARRDLLINSGLSVFFLGFFYALYGFSNFATSLHSWRIHWYFAAETGIPLVPWMAAVYLSINPLLMLAPFVFRTPRQMIPLLLALCAETVIAVPFFLLLPAANGFPAVAEGSAPLLLRIANGIKLDYNLIPSLHIAFAATAILAYMPRFRVAERIVLLSWGFAIALSTLFIHAHHLIDLAAGIGLAGVAVRWIYRPLLRPGHAWVAAVEGFCDRRLDGAEPRGDGETARLR